MNTDIIGCLLNNGYKAFRRYSNGEEETKDYKNFSSVSDGGLLIIFKKEDKEVYYGLHEYGYPPHIIYPYYENNGVVLCTEKIAKLEELGAEEYLKGLIN